MVAFTGAAALAAPCSAFFSWQSTAEANRSARLDNAGALYLDCRQQLRGAVPAAGLFYAVVDSHDYLGAVTRESNTGLRAR